MDTKVCSRCKVAKPTSEYFRDRRRKSGLQERCKLCDYSYHIRIERLERPRNPFIVKRGPRIHRIYIPRAIETTAKPKVIKPKAAPKVHVPKPKREPKPKPAPKMRVLLTAEEIRLRRAAKQRINLARRRTDPAYRAWKAAKDRQYRQTPEGKLRSYRNKMRRKAQGAGTHLLKAAEWDTLLKVFNSQCAYCLEVKPLVRDHFIPVIRGGDTTIKNIVPACHKCNSDKGAKLPNDWCSPEQYHRVLNVLAHL